MAKTRVTLNGRGMKELLHSSEVRDDLTRRATPVLAVAQASAPVESGAYRDSLRIEQATTDRAVVRVIADVDHGLVVEAKTGTLARALDAAGGA
jgi:hypothetical protein